MLCNLSEICDDPELAQAFQILKRAPTVNADRSTSIATTSTVQTVGVITPAKPATLNMLPEGTRLENVIDVITNAALTTGDDASSADVVVYQGKKWLVYSAEYWQDFGYTKAIAIRNDNL